MYVSCQCVCVCDSFSSVSSYDRAASRRADPVIIFCLFDWCVDVAGSNQSPTRRNEGKDVGPVERPGEYDFETLRFINRQLPSSEKFRIGRLLHQLCALITELLNHQSHHSSNVCMYIHALGPCVCVFLFPF